MLDIKFIRENLNVVKEAVKNKQFDPALVDKVLVLDEKRRKLIGDVEKLRAAHNKMSEELKGEKNEETLKKAKEIKEELKALEETYKNVEKDFNEAMYWVPNIPDASVPIGKDETGNLVVATWGEKPTFNFPVKDHVSLGEDLDLLDIKRGVKIGGFRSFFTKNELVALEYGLLDFALKHMVKKGFTPMTVPWLVSDKTLYGTGYFPWGIEDHYKTQDDTKLIGTAEVSLTAYYMDEVLDEKDLPIKMVGISPCFRREIGSYGKDTRGIFRLHQFNKVEQVVLCCADHDESVRWHEEMRNYSEEVLRALELPYQVLLMCTGDMGAGQVKKYDIETWFPAQKKYRETHSDSFFHDFQSRRLNMRYRTKTGEVKFVHTLNNTVAATPRILGAILENYQQADGSVKIPNVLQPYVGKEEIRH